MGGAGPCVGQRIGRATVTAPRPARAHGVSSRSTTTNSTSKATANATDSTAPTTMGVGKSRLSPSLIRSPKPPSPMSAVTVTRPTVVTVAMRRPATMAGVASGRSTRSTRRQGSYPMPSAASRTSGATPSSPATMLRSRMSSV
jgi:hypothetical protein